MKDIRATILSRRAHFVGAALAAIEGCSPNRASPPPEVPVAEPGPHQEGQGEHTPGGPEEARTPLPPVPKLDLPETSCDQDRRFLERAREVFTQAYAETEAVYRDLPSRCAVTESRCETDYARLAKRINEVADAVRRLEPLCGPLPTLLADYLQPRRVAFLERLSWLEEQIAEASASQGRSQAAKERWQELLRGRVSARPCLSCVASGPEIPKSYCDES